MLENSASGSGKRASYQVLARRARPQAFADVVGQEHVTRTLVNAISSGRLAHAFVFSGMRGVGKTTTARILAKALNCERGPTPEPCNQCSACIEIAEGRSLDVMEVDAASQTGIDAARELLETVKYQPASGRYRVYIIDEAHGLSRQAVDAFLKTLEEPPPHVKFILATTSPQKLTPTILSRCQRYDFRAIPQDDIVHMLETMVRGEGMEADEEALRAIARESGGSLRDATSLLDQVLAFAEGKLDIGQVEAALGLPDHAAVRELLDAIAKHDPAAALDVVARVVRQATDLARFVHEVLERVRHLTVLKVADRSALSDLSRAEVDDLVRAAEGLEPADLQRWFHILLDGYEEISRSRHPRLVLEMAMVRMATLAPLVPLDELVTRLEALEAGRGGGPVTPVRPRPVRPAPAPPPPPAPRSEAVPISPAGGVLIRSPRDEKQSRSGSESGHHPPAPRTPPPQEEGPAPEASEQARWRGLVESLQRERASRFFRLAYSRLLEIGDGVIRIAVAGPEAIAALAESETRRMIEQAIEREYGRALRFEPVAPDGRAGGLPPRSDPRSIERLGREDPLVQMSVEVLQGKVEAVVPREPRED